MQTSARNQYAGKIKEIESGPVMTEVSIEIAGGHVITATLTSASARRMSRAVAARRRRRDLHRHQRRGRRPGAAHGTESNRDLQGLPGLRGGEANLREGFGGCPGMAALGQLDDGYYFIRA